MSNYKIKVTSKTSKEAQELFFQLGYGFEGCKNKTIQEFEYVGEFYLFAYNDKDLTVSSDEKLFIQKTMHKELTLEELRAMASTEKEYINKTTGEYRKTSDVVSGEQWIAIPDGAEKATLCNGFIIFWKQEKYSFSFDEECKWCYKANSDSIYYDFDEYMNTYGDAVVLWQRPTQPEALPFVDDDFIVKDNKALFDKIRSGAIQVKFVDDEPSLNDKYAEIEKVRQAQRENNHYFINVSDVDEVDFYEIAKRYNVADPAIQHILKKCLAIGNRGHKDLETDLRDILKSAKRALEINGFSL